MIGEIPPGREYLQFKMAWMGPSDNNVTLFSDRMKSTLKESQQCPSWSMRRVVFSKLGFPVFMYVSSQVIHPFYVFQIASIILWSLDDYYYYAFCIALISAVSVVTTLIETKKVPPHRQNSFTVPLKPICLDYNPDAGNVQILVLC